MKPQPSSTPLALDIVLRNFLQSPVFTALPQKNWSAISRTVSGTTAKQVQRRYDELYQQSLLSGLEGGHGTLGCARSANRTESEQQPAQPPSAKFKVQGTKGEKENSSAKSEDKAPGSADQSFLVSYLKKKLPKTAIFYPLSIPMGLKYQLNRVMVIHVCDEAKNLKQDFHCPRDLLVREMRYFAEYLTTDAQRWEEVDISVHCDVQIFDWLMDYVQQSSNDTIQPPRLEPNNVVSILISSDFLKMDNLVAECIEYCHANMSTIVASPCNMNCINDKLVGRISELFNHNEADAIKDRKDKFKSKIFSKKLEKLFDSDYNNTDSPECGATLYKCSICSKLLTKNLEKKIKCLHSRMLIDRTGSLSYQHMRDASWDVSDYLLDLKAQLKTWRDVYWRIWGTISSLTCSRCHDIFACNELGHCSYHPESATYDINVYETGVRQNVIGIYPCCGQRSLRFDPTHPNTGCKMRDHVVHVTAMMTSPSIENVTRESRIHRLYEDLLAHRNAICQPYTQPVAGLKDDADLNVFARDEHASSVKEVISSTRIDSGHSEDGTKPEVRPQPRLQALTVERSVSRDEDVGMGESEDELGDDEEAKKLDGDGDVWKANMMALKGVTSWMKLRKLDTEGRKLRPIRKSKVTVDPQAILLDAPDFGSTKMRKWDSSRSMRWNQDAQREEDQRRMYEIITYLTKLRVTPDKLDKQKQREYAGGLYCRLEAQWKAVNMPPPRTSGAQIRSKPRLNTLKTMLN